MHKSSEMSYGAWVSLLWSQYSKLPEPLKEGFVKLTQSMVVEVKSQKIIQNTGKNKRSEN